VVVFTQSASFFFFHPDVSAGEKTIDDFGFRIVSSVLKCYEVEHPTKEQFNLIYALMRTRRVVECAFGRLLKGLLPTEKYRLYDAYVCMVLCALYM
jgi:hypothetical protein